MRLNNIASLSSRLLFSAAAGFQASRARRELARLPDHMLKDIGLARDEIDRFGR